MPAALVATERRSRHVAGRRGHQCMSAASAQASAMVRGSVATGAEGYHGPVTDETARAAREADDATRGSAVKLAAEVASRLLGLGTTLLLARALGVSDFGALGRSLVRRPAAGGAGRVRPSGDGDAGAGRRHLLVEGPRPGARGDVRPSGRGCARRPARVSGRPGVGSCGRADPGAARSLLRSRRLGRVPGRGPSLPRCASGGGPAPARPARRQPGGSRRRAPRRGRPRRDRVGPGDLAASGAGAGGLVARAPEGARARSRRRRRLRAAGGRADGRARRAADAEPARRVPRAFPAGRRPGDGRLPAPRFGCSSSWGWCRTPWRRGRCPPSRGRPSTAARV